MIDITIILISLTFSAFFSGMEIAYLSANKLKVELDVKKNTLSSKLLGKLIKNPDNYISTILLGNNIALVVYGIFMSKVILSIISNYLNSEFVLFLIQTVISTIVVIFFGEFIPKTLFRSISNNALNFFAVPLYFISSIFYPIVQFMMWLSRIILRNIFRINIDIDESKNAFGKIDIQDILENSYMNNENEHASQEFKLIQNALDFSKVKLRECIIPRTDIKAVAYDTELTDLVKVLISTGFSNILVYKDSIDEIIGYVNVKDVFKNPQSLKSIMRQVLIVPETMSAKKLLETFVENNKSLAVVVDEFGVTGGIVTIEDIMEEIFGDIEDEHDSPDFVVKKNKDGNYILSGRHEVDLLNEEFDFTFSENEDYETIAGYLLWHCGYFPNEDDIIEIIDNNNNFKFKILSIKDTRIEKLLFYNPLT